MSSDFDPSTGGRTSAGVPPRGLRLAPSDLPPPILVSHSMTDEKSAYAGELRLGLGGRWASPEMGYRIWGVVNVKVNVKEGYRLQATGYRELFVYLYGYVYEKRKS